MPNKNLVFKVTAVLCVFCIITTWYFYGRSKRIEVTFKAKEAELLKNEFELKNQIGSLESLLKEKTGFALALEDEKRELEVQLVSIRSESEKVKKAYDDLSAESSLKTDTTGRVAALKKENAALKKRLAAIENDPLIKKLKDLGGSVEDAAVRKILAATLQNIEQSRTGEAVNLDPIVISKALKDLPPDIKEEMIYANGKVISIDPQNSLAVVNIGKKDNLEVNDSCILLNESGDALGYGEVVSVRYQIAAVFIKKMQFDFKISDIKEGGKVLVAKTAI